MVHLDRRGFLTGSAAGLGSTPSSAARANVAETSRMFDRIPRFNPKLNGIVTLAAYMALARGRALDEALARGVPCSIKDTLDTAGVRTTAGAPFLDVSAPRWGRGRRGSRPTSRPTRPATTVRGPRRARTRRPDPDAARGEGRQPAGGQGGGLSRLRERSGPSGALILFGRGAPTLLVDGRAQPFDPDAFTACRAAGPGYSMAYDATTRSKSARTRWPSSSATCAP